MLRLHVTSLSAVVAPVMLAGLLGGQPSVPAGDDPAAIGLDEPGPGVAHGQFDDWSDEVSAYVWANRPTVDDYEPAPGYAYNSTGGVQVSRHGTGSYTVVFEGAAPVRWANGGVVHTSAYGSYSNAFCTVASWGPPLFGGDDLLAHVRCFAPNGAPADTRFVANYTNAVFEGDDGRLAYFWTDRAIPVGERTLTHDYQFDSQGGPITYERISTGRYRFDMPDNPDLRAFPMVHVTAYNTSAVICQIAWPDRWEVRCVDHNGAPTDSRFTLTYGVKVDLLGRTTSRFGSTARYADTIHDDIINGDSYVSTGSPGVHGTYQGTGKYQITFDGLGTGNGHALVNPVGGNASAAGSWPVGYCHVAYWWSYGGNENVGVRCYDFDGAAANLHARISFTTFRGVF
ncbi:hypothetical protein L0U85_10935 [Glycomyces sp. L485]|uniref:hypothetical protein n=1 Tax=Glycomyces sp. L485 TaxID=2909235 RepID=UPI001F4A6477|nr:hypothetical protein [Glycomyces sp. L485]MCH7231358.1 hypothetical protein [Glycomyces sp. L485]